ncbi:MAG TPA: ABC transporter substrate-binding protein [Actinomycetota bacterium]|jgi:peptide/nickel transport system substrate-binding protein|nr:ABC transporter substrate-binding protein [Actinomycetota bacterium]
MRARILHGRVLAFLAVVGLLAAACGGGGGGGEEPTGSASGGGNAQATIVHGTTDTVVSLDPAGSYDFGSWQIIYNTMDGLLEIPPQGNTPEPALADSCDFTDPTTYQCTLKSGLKFSDGSPVTSEDVVYSLQRNIEIADPNGACSLLAALADCKKWDPKAVDTPDPQTVVFHLRYPDGTWPFILTTPAAFVVPKASYPEKDKQPDEPGKVIGTGRYVLKDYRPGEQAVLEANPDFWGDAPANARVIVQYFSNESALKLALEQQEVDIAWRSLGPTAVSALENESGIQVLKGPGTEIRYLVFNLKFSPGKQLAVRKAVAYTIDRAAIAKNAWNGTVEPLYSMVPTEFAGHTDAFAEMYGENPDVNAAKKVLQDAGISTPVDLEIWYTPTHYGEATADEYAEIKRELEGSGLFKVTLKSAEWDQYSNAAFTDQYPIYQLGWFPDYVDADDYTAPFYSKGSFLNDHYSSPKMESLLKQEKAETDPAKREQIFAQIQKLGAEDVPIIPIWQGFQLAAIREGITGVDKTLDASFQFRYWLVSKAS